MANGPSSSTGHRTREIIKIFEVFQIGPLSRGGVQGRYMVKLHGALGPSTKGSGTKQEVHMLMTHSINCRPSRS